MKVKLRVTGRQHCTSSETRRPGDCSPPCKPNISC